MRVFDVQRWRRRAAALRHDVRVLARCCRDDRVPWYAKALSAALVAYTLSPIDLIPDFIPVIGHLDELVIVPVGMGLVLKLIPAEVLAAHRAAVQAGDAGPASPDDHGAPPAARV